MTNPDIFQKSPLPTEVEEGKTYFWCACGKSTKQPYCDGSHKGTEFSPVKYTAEKRARSFSVDVNTAPKHPCATERIQSCKTTRATQTRGPVFVSIYGALGVNGTVAAGQCRFADRFGIGGVGVAGQCQIFG